MYERVLAWINHIVVLAAEIFMALTSMMFIMVICGNSGHVYTRYSDKLPSIFNLVSIYLLLVITIMLCYSGYVTFLELHIMVVGSFYWILCYTC